MCCMCAISGGQFPALPEALHSTCKINCKHWKPLRLEMRWVVNVMCFLYCQMSSKLYKIYRGQQISQRSLWFCQSILATLLLLLNAPRGRGRKGLHLSNWNASAHCVPFHCNSVFEGTNTFNLCSQNNKGQVGLAKAFWFCEVRWVAVGSLTRLSDTVPRSQWPQ